MPHLKKKLLIMVDDHPQIRKILEPLLVEHHDGSTLYTANNPRELLSLTNSRLTEADTLTVVDISLTKTPDAQVSEEPQTQCRQTPPFIVVSSQEHGITANWFVPIDHISHENNATWIEATRDQRKIVIALAQGLRVSTDGIDPDVAQEIPSIEGLMKLGLTQRQSEVLSLLAEGLSNKEIACQLDLSEWTVRRHVSAILSRLEVNSRGRAAVFARQWGQTPSGEGLRNHTDKTGAIDKNR